MKASLGQRVTAECAGTAMLVAIVVGSGIAAQRLSNGDPGLQLLENAFATAGGIAALIWTFGPVSGAHFNPIVTIAARLSNQVTTHDALAYVAAQVGGACAGASIANVMFGLEPITVSTTVRSGSGLWVGEIVATFGLVIVILGVSRGSQGIRSLVPPIAVAGYLAAAYWFTSSTSFANPAVTIGRTLSNTFAGIEPTSAPAFIAAQFTGATAAIALARYLFPELSADDATALHDHSGTT
ncbi:MAG: aquaporin family protein [Acidimicrobiales bacterium]|nr:aquaporin family protein [Acidimicrobiales bacterium]